MDDLTATALQNLRATVTVLSTELALAREVIESACEEVEMLVRFKGWEASPRYQSAIIDYKAFKIGLPIPTEDDGIPETHDNLEIAKGIVESEETV